MSDTNKARQAAENTQQAAVHTQRAATQTKAAAQLTAHAAVQTKSAAERATELAADRTVLAYERTYAAWLRTGLGALASGVGAMKLLDGLVPLWVALFASALLLLFAVFAFVAGVWRSLARIEAPAPEAPRLPGGILIAANLCLALVALAALLGIVLTRTG